jgi:lysophospholipase L1-like esterase
MHVIPVKLKEIKFFAFGTILVVTVLFGTLELSTRLISWFTGNGFYLSLHEYDPYDSHIERIYQWHPFTGLTFRPGISFKGSHPYQVSHPTIIIDQNGFLSDGHMFSAEKPADEIRIATIGASTTANINLSYSENWPGVLGNLLQQALPNKKIRVLNAGVPGFDTAQSIGNLALRVMPLKPDIVIIYNAYNDLKAIKKESNFKPDYSHYHKKPWGIYPKPNILIRGLNFSMVYVRLRNKYREHKKITSTIKYEHNFLSGKTRLDYIPREALKTFDQHIRILISIAQSEGAQVVLSSFATLHDSHVSYRRVHTTHELSEFQKTELFSIGYYIPALTIDAVFSGINQYNAVLKQAAIDKHTGWVDNAAMIPHEDKYFADRVHFSAEGAALMAKNLFPMVKNLLARK